MKLSDCKYLIKADYIQLCGRNKQSRFKLILRMLGKLITNASFKITFWFRIGNYLLSKKNLLWRPLFWIVLVVYNHYKFKTGIQMPLGTKIGPGIVFPHFGCQIIHENAVIGCNAHIFQRVTIGGMKGEGIPKLGDNVVVFGGASIIGDITIGDNVVIGAGAVVVKDVPSGSVVAGVPAKVISQRGPEIVGMYIF